MRLVLLYQNNLGTGIFRRLAPRIRYGGSAVSPAFMQRARVARPAAVVGKALLRKRFCGFGVHAAKAAQTLRELRPQRVDRQDKNAALCRAAFFCFRQCTWICLSVFFLYVRVLVNIAAQLFIKLRWSICANRAHCSFCIGDLYCIFSPFDQLMPLPVAALLPICERLFGEVDQWHVIVDHHSAIFKFRKRIFYRFAQRALFRYPRFCQNGDMYRSTATWGSWAGNRQRLFQQFQFQPKYWDHFRYPIVQAQ